MNKTELLDRCARSGEERTLLARVLDKLELAQNRGVPAHTPFLTPGEQAAAADLLTAWGNPRYAAFGGYEGAERNILYFPPTGRSRRTPSPTRRAPWPPWRGHSQTGPRLPTGTFWGPSWAWASPGRSWGTF